MFQNKLFVPRKTPLFHEEVLGISKENLILEELMKKTPKLSYRGQIWLAYLALIGIFVYFTLKSIL